MKPKNEAALYPRSNITLSHSLSIQFSACCLYVSEQCECFAFNHFIIVNQSVSQLISWYRLGYLKCLYWKNGMVDTSLGIY